MRCWETGRQPDLQEERVIFDPEIADVDGEERHRDDDEWMNWRVDDPEADIFDELNEDDGPETPKQSMKLLRKEVTQELIPGRHGCCLV